jgi:hypothetical protein
MYWSCLVMLSRFVFRFCVSPATLPLVAAATCGAHFACAKYKGRGPATRLRADPEECLATSAACSAHVAEYTNPISTDIHDYYNPASRYPKISDYVVVIGNSDLNSIYIDADSLPLPIIGSGGSEAEVLK